MCAGGLRLRSRRRERGRCDGCDQPWLSWGTWLSWETALSGRGVEKAAHAPRLLAHMEVYMAGLRTPGPLWPAGHSGPGVDDT